MIVPDPMPFAIIIPLIPTPKIINNHHAFKSFIEITMTLKILTLGNRDVNNSRCCGLGSNSNRIPAQAPRAAPRIISLAPRNLFIEISRWSCTSYRMVYQR